MFVGEGRYATISAANETNSIQLTLQENGTYPLSMIEFGWNKQQTMNMDRYSWLNYV